MSCKILKSIFNQFGGADSYCGYDWWELKSISDFSEIIKVHSHECRFNWIKCERTFSNVFACRIQCRYKKSISQLDRKLLVWRLMSGNVNKKSAVYDKKKIDIVSSGKSQDHYWLTPIWLADLLIRMETSTRNLYKQIITLRGEAQPKCVWTASKTQKLVKLELN